MTEAEKRLLQEFAQTRIESHFSRYRESLTSDARQAEEDLYDGIRAARLFHDLEEEPLSE